MSDSGIVCCIQCGRDTPNKDGICWHCRRGGWFQHHRDYSDRRFRSPKEMEADEFAQYARNNDDFGWPYDDNDEEDKEY